MSYIINKPSTARQKFIFVSENETNIYKVLASAGCELVSVNITAGSAPATFRLVDASSYSSGYNLESGPAYAVAAGQSYSPNLLQPMPFKKGVILVCEQGVGSNAEASVTLNGN